MKNVFTSNGKFNITNILYESIKKNNPELLESDKKATVDIDLIKSIYKDVYGDESQWDGEKLEKYVNMFLNVGSSDAFENALELDKSINNPSEEYNSKKIQNNLDSILNKFKKRKISQNDGTYIKYATYLIKLAYGKFVNNDLIKKTIKKYNEYLGKDPDGEITGFDDALEKMKEDLVIVSKMIQKLDQNNSSDSSLSFHKNEEMNINNQPYNMTYNVSYDNKNNKNNSNQILKNSFEITNKNILLENENNNEIEKFIEFFINDSSEDLKDTRKKFEELINNDNDIDNNDDNDNGSEKIDKIQLIINKKSGLKNIYKDFIEYLKDYNGYDDPRPEKYIKKILELYIPDNRKENIDKCCMRYIEIFGKKNSNNLIGISDENDIKSVKDHMLQIIIEVIEDCDYLENILNEIEEKSNNEKSFKDIKNKINGIFLLKGIDYIQSHIEKLSNNLISNKEKNIPIEELKKRIKLFVSVNLSNKSVEYIEGLLNTYDKNATEMLNNESNNIKKIKCLRNVCDAINNARNILTNPRKNLNIEEIKQKTSLLLKEIILGLNISNLNLRTNLALQHDIKKYVSQWIDNNKNFLFSDNNLLKFLTNNEFNELLNTCDYMTNSITNDAQKKEYYERFKTIIDKSTFDSEIPHSIMNYIQKINSGLIGKVIIKLPFLKIYDFGKKKEPFLNSNVKEIYCDKAKNDKLNYQGVNVIDIYRSLPYDEFWKNCMVYNCWTEEAYRLVLAYISRESRKDEISISQEVIPTGLEARTTIYVLNTTKENDEEKMKSRNGKNLFSNIGDESNDNELKINQQDINFIKELKRYYFLVVTEGRIKKGKLFNIIKNNVKNGLRGKNFAGIDTSGYNLN